MSKLSANTERAITLLTVDKGNKLLYWPSYLRGGTRITPDGVATRNPPTEKEQLERIVEADPLGFLLALMNGQPVPVLHKNDDFDSTLPEGDKNLRYFVKEEVANIGMRRDIAQHLLTKVIAAKPRRERIKQTLPKGASIFDQANERASHADKDDQA
jgi:hypothetical protein